MIVICTVRSESEPKRVSWHSVVLADETSDKYNTNIPFEVRKKIHTTGPDLRKVLKEVRWCYKNRYDHGPRLNSPYFDYMLKKYNELSKVI